MLSENSDLLVEELFRADGFRMFMAYWGGRHARHTAVIKASRGASSSSALQNPTFLLIAFSIHSVVFSSVLQHK